MSRRSIEVANLGHAQPIPLASRVGPLLASGLIGGKDAATGQMPPDFADQCRNMFANMRAVVEAAGGSIEDIVKVDIYLRDRAQREAVNEDWLRTFPDEASRPARHAHTADLTGTALIQCDITAFIQSGEAS